MPDRNSSSPEPTPAPRKPWIVPAVVELPRLQNLTLQTGVVDPGGPTVLI